MKNKVLLLSVSMVVGVFSTNLLAEPYADKIKVTSKTSAMSKMMIEGANVP